MTESSSLSPEKSPSEKKNSKQVQESTLVSENEDLPMSNANKRRKLDDKKEGMVKLHDVSI